MISFLQTHTSGRKSARSTLRKASSTIGLLITLNSVDNEWDPGLRHLSASTPKQRESDSNTPDKEFKTISLVPCVSFRDCRLWSNKGRFPVCSRQNEFAEFVFATRIRSRFTPNPPQHTMYLRLRLSTISSLLDPLLCQAMMEILSFDRTKCDDVTYGVSRARRDNNPMRSLVRLFPSPID